MNTIAIHQPNYLPWLGYFYKIWASDVFVLHDNVEYTKQSLTKRVFIRKTPVAIDKTYLSVSLRRHSDFMKIKDLRLCNDHQWHIEHLNKIYNAYHKAPYFNQYYAVLEGILRNAHYYETLKYFNEVLIKQILNTLDINTLVFSSSELPRFDAKADSLNAAIAEYLGCKRYISGQGALKYQCTSTYKERGIDLIYNNVGRYLMTTPPQYPIPFDPSLSILDALFYIGKDGILDIFKSYKNMELNNYSNDRLLNIMKEKSLIIA
jgi:hypothetical protein